MMRSTFYEVSETVAIDLVLVELFAKGVNSENEKIICSFWPGDNISQIILIYYCYYIILNSLYLLSSFRVSELFFAILWQRNIPATAPEMDKKNAAPETEILATFRRRYRRVFA